MNTCKKSKAAEEYLTVHPDFLPELEKSCPKDFARYDYLSEKMRSCRSGHRNHWFSYPAFCLDF